MHDLLEVGFSLQHAVQFSQRALPKLSRVFSQIDHRLATGTLLANTLKPYLRIDIYYQLLLAEQHGDVSAAFNEIGNFLRLQKQQRRQLKGLLEYPLILLVLMGMIFLAMMIFIFPELKSWQVQNQLVSRQRFPWLELMLSIILALLIDGLYHYRHWRKMTKLRQVDRQCHWLIVGKLFRQYYGYYLTVNLSVLLQHGFSLHEICQIAADFDTNSLLYQVSQEVQSLSNQGHQLTEYILKKPFLPDELAIFVNRGLSNERLGNELSVFAKMKFNQLRNSTTHLLVLVQPLLFVLIAGGIVTMYLSILLPIYGSLQEVY